MVYDAFGSWNIDSRRIVVALIVHFAISFVLPRSYATSILGLLALVFPKPKLPAIEQSCKSDLTVSGNRSVNFHSPTKLSSDSQSAQFEIVYLYADRFELINRINKVLIRRLTTKLGIFA
jgi:uncharacterized membrane protein YraQ (UPF0718 family)